MKSKMEKSLSLVLVLCLVFTTVLANASAKAKAVSAKSLKRENASNVGIILGIPSWNSGRTAYTFPNVQATFTEGKQKVFCISVENGGYFTAPIDDMDADNLDITVVENDGRYNANVDGDTQYPLSNNRKLISMTVLGDMSEEQIEAYIKKITFYRGYIDTSTKQSISIISSEFDAEKEGATAMVIDGKLHFYKYIDWQFETSISYKDGTVATIPASSVSEDSTQFSWFKAYELAKKETMNGLKGYLATITSVSEQKYIYKKLGVPRKEVEVDGLVEKWGGAWIGGARSFSADEIDSATEVVFDSDTMSALYPSNDTGTMCTLWRWMCGP
ncbi:MAG: hypothetical protein K6D02_08080, partial [Lachnospiraceae bacterium]|nr:hypothetical protein [Lachnospiraceae bacterium]